MTESDTAAAGPAFPPVLKRFWIFHAALTGFAALWTAMLALVLKSPPPFGLLLLYGWNLFGDFRFFGARFIHFREPGFWARPGFPMTYPAPVGVCLGLLFKLSRPLPLYLGVCAAVWVVWQLFLERRFEAKGISRVLAAGFIATVALTTWPFWLLMNTANMEGFVTIAMGAATLAIVRQRWWLAAVLIGIGGSLKIYPFILLCLLFTSKKYWQMVVSVAVGAIVTVASLAILGPTIAEANRHVGEGMVYLADHYIYAISLLGAGFDHSLFSTLKLVMMTIPALAPYGGHGHLLAPTPLQAIQEKKLLDMPLKIYVTLAAGGGIAAWFLRIRKMPMLNQMLALCTCAVLLPPMSIDYTLLNLTVPFGVLCLYAVDRWRNGVAVKGLGTALMCFPFIYAPGQMYYPFPLLWLACQLRTAALAVLLITILRCPFERPHAEASGDFGWV